MSTPEVTASAERDGSYVIRVKLPGVTSAKEVSAVVEDDPANGGCRLEVVSPPEAHRVPRYRLSHPVPFVALEGTSPDVKFGKKTATLTVTFERIDEVRVPGLEHFETNDALYLATHPTKGRCVRARREIKPGETILRCAPFVHVVHDRRREDHCAGCFKTLESSVRGVRRLLRSEVLRRRLPRERRRPRRRVFHGSNERGNRRGPARRAHVPAIDPQTANGSRAIRRGHGRASMREKSPTPAAAKLALRGASRGGIGPVGGGGHAGQNAGELARRGGLEAAAVGHGDIPRGFHV